MSDITTASGKLLQTERLPEHIEPMFCSECGCRIGWYHTGYGEEAVGYCDDCAADLAE